MYNQVVTWTALAILAMFETILHCKGRHKKLFFFTLSKKKTETPTPPFLTTSVFSDTDFFNSAQTPHPFSAKNGNKNTIFF